MNIRSVAIIGGGPSAPACIKALKAENHFTLIKAYEQQPANGGVWNYNGFTRPTPYIPSVSATPSEPQEFNANGTAKYYNPMYRDLSTNLPHMLMAYNHTPFPENTELFPDRDVVRKYVEGYCEDVRDHFVYDTQVTGLTKQGDKWVVESSTKGKPNSKETFDSVILCTGHYNHPYVPNVPGIAEYAKTHNLLHAKYYDHPETYENKTVLVVGNSSSGVDLANQIAEKAKTVYVSARSKSKAPQAPHPSLKNVGLVTKYEDGKIYAQHAPGDDSGASDDSEIVLTDIDSVIYCTGYLYSFPYLKSYSDGKPTDLMSDGVRMHNLYRQLFYINDPTISFICMPKNVVPFPLAETQGATIARVWSGRLPLPSVEDQKESLRKEEELRGTGSAHHTLQHPRDAEYQTDLTEWLKTCKNPTEGFFGVEWDEERYHWRRDVKKRH